MRTLRTLALVPMLALAFAACGGGSGDAPNADVPVTSAGTSPTTHSTAAWQPIDGIAGTARASLPVYASIDASAPASTLPVQTQFGSPMTLRVLAAHRDGAWLRVALPTRPNGSTGFVRAADVTITRVTNHVDIDLTARHLRVVDASGAVVIDTPVAIGSQENPTPTGDFYVTDVIDTANADGAYGPYALGLSAHSETLSEFAGGDGEIGLHGTNQPASIGNAVSHGCVRVPNDVVVRLVGMLALGSPVTIR
jgi:lipoprotein-anchoring transpeptidase ErfK/SrfK